MLSQSWNNKNAWFLDNNWNFLREKIKIIRACYLKVEITKMHASLLESNYVKKSVTQSCFVKFLLQSHAC